MSSALEPAAREAARIADLFWGLTIGTAILWIAVVGLAVYAAYSRGGKSRSLGTLLIVGGGVLLPVVVLAFVLTVSLAMLPDLLAPASEEALRIEVTGHQWWWRVRYRPEEGEPVDLANEIHLPAGRPVEFQLESRDVIHSFWIPALAGKVDMIPGRRTRLRVEPTKTGTFRGVCAEYCGTSHALMSFFVVVEEPAAFDRWLAHQAAPARAAAIEPARRGGELFLRNGCGACHTIRGTPADGRVGPDLTHVGGRLSVGAGILESDARAFRHWVARTDAVKPGVHMPHFGMLPPHELDAIAVYLEGLR